MTLMRGPYALRTIVVNYLTTAVPEMAAKAQAQWPAGTFEFVLPGKYLPYEPDGISSGDDPLVGVGITRTRGFARVDYDDLMAEQYRPTYTVRVYLWCYTPNSLDQVPQDAQFRTMRQRDDLATIIRACILDRLSLGNPDLVDVNEGTLTEEYSDGAKVPNNSGRWIAGVVFTFDVKFDESLYRQAVGQVPESGIEIETALLPKVGD
jgi:hypothetical protein